MFKICLVAAGFFIGTVLSLPAAGATGWRLNQNDAPRGDYYHLTPEMREVVEDILYSRFYTSEKQLARRIFDWMAANITYAGFSGTQSAAGVFSRGRGKCGGQTRLFIALARDLGIETGYARVDVDQYGNEVRHACVFARLDGREYLIDPAYGLFDARHREWRVVSDEPGFLLMALQSPPR